MIIEINKLREFIQDPTRCQLIIKMRKEDGGLKPTSSVYETIYKEFVKSIPNLFFKNLLFLSTSSLIILLFL